MSANELEPLGEFERHGMNASYHFADDTNSEWTLAVNARDKALRVFDEHPKHQNKMRETAKGFLWADEFARLRPETPEGSK